MDLYSINYLHFGAPKIWYAISPNQREEFEKVSRSQYHVAARECNQFLRHKGFMMSPSVIMNGNINLTHAVQNPRDFMITLPGAYHFGFNTGFNCAESVNFAFKRWIQYGIAAQPCKCISDLSLIHISEPTRPY
eukprot:TRINITY_DN6314_c0_g1_i1.p1 TRINITY_DN6314_c0_g1~~TRINITY_DN6314_c0_g1_i1.p1  ORF type:complete len:134 (-),score=6.07 TRINITY_DN6314_c0_g1_i1:18-419(-)